MECKRFLGIANRKAMKFLSILSFIGFVSLFSSMAYAETVLFQDDFEEGNTDGWVLDSGWALENESGNFVLSGNGHYFANAGDNGWPIYRFSAKIKLMDENSCVHMNYRSNCTRYFIGLCSGEINLSKTFPCGTHTDIERLTESHSINRWYNIEIIGDGNQIQVYLDGVLKFTHVDSEPILKGGISFESLDNSHVHVDDIIVTTKESASSVSKWTATGGPLGGLGYDIRINPLNKNTMFVSDNFAGVARSENAGQTWTPSNFGISIRSGNSGDAVNIFSLTIDPNNPDILWTGTFGEGSAFGVYKSIDGGLTWATKTNGITLGGAVGLVFRGFTVQQGNSNIVYAQAEIPTPVNGLEFNRVKGRVYKTENGGESWNMIWEGDNLARYLIIDPTSPQILYLSTGIFDREAYNSDCENDISGGVGVLKSADGGKTWQTANNGLTDLYVGCLRMHPTNPKVLFAATGNNACSGLYKNDIKSGLFMTSDGATSWTKAMPENDILTTVNFSPSNPNIVYAGSSFAFYRSEDGGSNWTRYSKAISWGPPGVNSGFPIDVVVDPENPFTLYANNYIGGVVRSTDGAKTWEDWGKGYTGAQIRKVTIPKNLNEAVYTVGRSGPFFSPDYGQNWTGIANGDAHYAEWYSVAIHPANHKIILLSDEHQGVILRSNDGGADFVDVLRHPNADAGSNGLRQGFKSLVFSPSDASVVYAGLARPTLSFLDSSPVGTVIYKSNDAGANFYPMPSIIDGHNVNKLVVHPQDSNTLYAATSNGVYKSTDGASNWTHLAGLGNRFIMSLAFHPAATSHLVAGELFGGIWISEDGGASWTGPYVDGFNSSNPYISSLVVDPKNPNTYFAGDLYSGIYRSEDYGYTWSPFPDWKMSGLTVGAVTDIAINDSVIYAGTEGGGVFRYFRNCFTIGADLSLEIPCAEYAGTNYGFVLNFYSNPGDPSGLYWKMNLDTLKGGSGGDCITIGTDLSLPISCAEYSGTRYGFTLSFYSNPNDPSGYYWKMDMSTLMVK